MNTTFSNDQNYINLVIGYGDKKKSDEGAGCHVAELIAILTLMRYAVN